MNAVVNLLEAHKFSSWQHADAHTTTTSAAKATSDTTVAMDFVCKLLAAGRVTVRPSFVIRLLQHLVDVAGAQGTSGRCHREEQFVQIIQVVGINTAGQPHDREKLSAQVSLAAVRPALLQCVLHSATTTTSFMLPSVYAMLIHHHPTSPLLAVHC